MKRITRHWHLGPTVTVIVLLGLAAGAIVLWPHATNMATSSKPTSKTPATTTQAPPSSTLAITALNQYATPGGTIKTTQQLTARGGCTTSVIAYPSDGLTIYALMQIPITAKPAAGYPVVIVDHGYYPPASWSTTNTSDQDYLNGLCAAGIIAIRPDFRGNGPSQGTANGGDIYADYIYDNLNLIHSLGSLAQANTKNVGVEGHSMGGAVALKTIVVDKDIKASVITAGVTTTMQNIVYNWSPNPIPSDNLAQQTAAVSLLGGTPQQASAAWNDASAINYVSSISGPVQINAGTADKTVPYAWSQAFDNALTKAGKDHVFNTYPDADHIFSNPADRSLLVRNMVSFFQTHLQ